jgi:hypothetical protein
MSPAHHPRNSARRKLPARSIAMNIGIAAIQARAEKSNGVTAKNHRQPLKVLKASAP